MSQPSIDIARISTKLGRRRGATPQSCVGSAWARFRNNMLAGAQLPLRLAAAREVDGNGQHKSQQSQHAELGHGVVEGRHRAEGHVDRQRPV